MWRSSAVMSWARPSGRPGLALGRVALYGLRFVLAAPSTATGLRRQVLDMTPLPAADVESIEPPAAYIYPCPDCRSQVALPDGSCASCGLPTRAVDASDDRSLAGSCQDAESQPGPAPAAARTSKTARFLAAGRADTTARSPLSTRPASA